MELIRKRTGLKPEDGIELVPYPPKRTILDQYLKSNADQSVEARVRESAGVRLQSMDDRGHDAHHALYHQHSLIRTRWPRKCPPFEVRRSFSRSADLWICETRLSLMPSTPPISFIVISLV